MSSDKDLRLAALRKHQKANFVGSEAKKAQRVSDLRNRQKQKRRSVWDQGREGLAELEEEELALEPKQDDKENQMDRKQMLQQWKKRRDELTARMKARQLKPFKAGSKNVGAVVPLPSVDVVTKPSQKPKPKPATKPVPPQFSARTVRSSTQAQRKENATAKPARTGRAGKGKKKTDAAAEVAATGEPAPPPPMVFQPNVLGAFNFQGSGAMASEKFPSLFPGGEFSPFKFNFRKKLDATGLVTVRGQKPATPPQGLATADSPALWPMSPGKGSFGPGLDKTSRTPAQKVAAMSRLSGLVASPAPPSAKRSSRRNSPAVLVASNHVSASPCGAQLASLSLASPARSFLPMVTRGEASSAASTSSDEDQLPSAPEEAEAEKIASSPVASAASVSAPFRQVMDICAGDLDGLATVWEATADEVRSEVSGDVMGRIDTTIGQARLLVRERFTQFSKLCDGADNPSAEKATHASDLQGFWDMVGFQVDDVKQKFATLETIKANDWQVAKTKTPRKAKPKPKAKRAPAKKKTPGKAAAAANAARARMREFRNAKKLELAAAAALEAENENTGDDHTSSVSTPSRAASSSRKGTPVATTPALLKSAKKRKSVVSTPARACSSQRSTPLKSARRKSKIAMPAGLLDEDVPTTSATPPRRSKVSTPKSSHKAQTPKAAAVSAKKATPLNQPAASQGFDFTQYIAPMSASKPITPWKPSWLASSLNESGDDLMSFSPATAAKSAKKIRPIGQCNSPDGAFVRRLAQRTPVSARRQVSSIASLNKHVVVTPVRRSLRLQTPGKLDAGAAALADLAEYSVWPNNALE